MAVGSRSDFNYVRNSVKVTVDAYDGTVKFYVIDKKDPIIRAYEEAFPDLFTPRHGHAGRDTRPSALPRRSLHRAIRRVRRYHVTEPRRFYNGSGQWLRLARPERGRHDLEAVGEHEHRRDERAIAGDHRPRPSDRIRTTCTSRLPEDDDGAAS